jgi:hypothetical protein
MDTSTTAQLSFLLIRHLRTMARNGRPLRALVMANEQGHRDLLFQVLYSSIASGILSNETANLAHTIMGVRLVELPPATREAVISALNGESIDAAKQYEQEIIERPIPTTYRAIAAAGRRAPVRRLNDISAKTHNRVRYALSEEAHRSVVVQKI